MNYDPNKAIRQALMVARRQVTAPNNMTIRGQDHILAYITPREAELLAKRGGSGRITKYGIPAFDDGNGPGGDPSDNSNSMSEASTQSAVGGNEGTGAGPTGAGAGATGEVGSEDTDVGMTATTPTAQTPASVNPFDQTFHAALDFQNLQAVTPELSPAAAPAPFGTQGFGQAPSAFGMGAIGTIAGLGLGVPGLGMLGTALGTGLDVQGLNAQLGKIGHAEDIDRDLALANAMTLGALGVSARDQFAQKMGFPSYAESPMSSLNQQYGLPDAPPDTSGGPSVVPIIRQPQQNPMEDAEMAQQQALMASRDPMRQPLMLASGGAAGGMPGDDPAVQQALDITRQTQPSAPQMAVSVQPQARPIEENDINAKAVADQPISQTTEDFNFNIDRGKRKEIKAKLAPEDMEKINKIAQDHKLTPDEVEYSYRKLKNRFPASQWAPFNIVGVQKDNESVVRDAEGYPELKVQEQAYNFHKPKGSEEQRVGATDWDSAHLNRVTKNIVKAVRDVADREDAGDKNASVIMKARNWYRAMRDRLRQEYGGFADTMADMLGATSAQTGVRQNWDNTIEALSEFSRGSYDRALGKLQNWVDQGGEMGSAAVANGKGYINGHLNDLKAALPDAIKQAKEEGLTNEKQIQKRAKEIAFQKAQEGEFPLITKADGKTLFNANTPAAMMAFLDKFRERKAGDSPKTPNFTGNLIGYSDKATIDLWAARFLRRMAGMKPVPTAAESGVSGAFLAEPLKTGIQVGGEFGFGQQAFQNAAKELRKDPRFAGLGDDDLQAIVWFLEKEHWTKNDWTNKTGEGGSFEQEANFAGVPDREKLKELRYQAENDATASDRQKISDFLSNKAPMEAAQKAYDENKWILDYATPAKQRDAVMDRMGITDKAQAVELAKNILGAAKTANNTLQKYPAAEQRLGMLEQKSQQTRASATQQLNDMQAVARRFVGGLSPDREENPATPEMFAEGQSALGQAINSSPSVMMSKATPSRGRYIDPEGNIYDEKSYDLEFVTRQNFDPASAWQAIVNEGKRRNQQSVFLSEVVPPGNLEGANPGIEVYFKKKLDDKATESLTKIINELGVDAGYTFVTDFRAKDRLAGGAPHGEYVGLRLQYIPEFGGGIEGMEKAKDDMIHAIEKIAKFDGVSNAKYVEYDTQVAMENEYERHLAGHVPEGRQAAWHKKRFGAGNETSTGSQGIPQGSPSTPPVYRRRGGQTDAGYQAQQTSLDPVIARALRLTAPDRPMVALADLFQRQLRGRPPS